MCHLPGFEVFFYFFAYLSYLHVSDDQTKFCPVISTDLKRGLQFFRCCSGLQDESLITLTVIFVGQALMARFPAVSSICDIFRCQKLRNQKWGKYFFKALQTSFVSSWTRCVNIIALELLEGAFVQLSNMFNAAFNSCIISVPSPDYWFVNWQNRLHLIDGRNTFDTTCWIVKTEATYRNIGLTYFSIGNVSLTKRICLSFISSLKQISMLFRMLDCFLVHQSHNPENLLRKILLCT